MCRNIRTLANFEPPATDDEIRASALQFVRKLSGSTKPSRANEAAFNQAVEEVTAAAERLVRSFTTSAPPRNREEEARKARERARERYAVARLTGGVWIVSLTLGVRSARGQSCASRASRLGCFSPPPRFMTPAGYAQAPPAGPTFDVVSIKPSPPQTGPTFRVNILTPRPDGGVTLTQTPVALLITRAYAGTNVADMVGLPAWASREFYDISATASMSSPTNDDRAAMMRAHARGSVPAARALRAP